jgi:hypothetical protein
VTEELAQPAEAEVTDQADLGDILNISNSRSLFSLVANPTTFEFTATTPAL